MKPIRTWVLVADGARARILANDGAGKGLRELEALQLLGSREHSRDILTDKPGRTFDSIGQGRHAMQGRNDPRDELELQFAQQIGEMLVSHVASYDRLIVVAAPATLGDLRNCVAPGVTQKITVEVDRDLTQLSVAQISKHLTPFANF